MKLLLLAAALCRALEVSPIYGFQALGGQYFHRGQKGALSGNASAVMAPALKLDESWALLPALQSSYQGTKSVVDLVGAGTLFQEQMDHRASLRAVWMPPASQWRLKPSVSYKRQHLKETKDEKWGKGLFDYWRAGAGLEAEFVYRDPFSIRAGVDYHLTKFPNYLSLESRSPGLARELAGAEVLNSRSFAFTLAGDVPLRERLVFDGAAVVEWRRYPHQRVVDETGALLDEPRGDLTATVVAGLRMPGELNTDLRLLGSFDVAVQAASSNQNSYDARAARHFPQFYNYREARATPSLKLLVGPAREPVIVGLSASVWLRQYPHRVAQDESGAYAGGRLVQRGWLGGASLTYPMAKRFSLLFNAQLGQASSNQRFEQFYRYDYTVANYLFGFSYDY